MTSLHTTKPATLMAFMYYEKFLNVFRRPFIHV